MEKQKTQKKIYVGGTLRDAAKRVVDAWHRTERGEKVAAQDNVTFVPTKSKRQSG